MTDTTTQNVPKLRFPGFVGAWKSSELREVAKIFDGTHQTPKYTTHGIPFVSVENINDIYSPTKFISEDSFAKDFKNTPKKNDILMTRITAGIIGATAIVENSLPLAYYVSLALIRPKDSADTPFLAQRIESHEFKRELHKRIIHVAFPKKINLGDIGKCVVIFPPLPEQQKIATFLSAVDTKIQQLEKKKTLWEQYKKGCMQQIFSQEIRFKADDGSDFPDWEERRLGDLVKVTTGSSNREDSENAGEYAFFDRSNDQRWSSKFLYDCEALIVAGEGKEFPPRYFKGKFDLHQRAYAITGFEEVSAKYLFYWINWHRYYFLKFSVGSTMPSLRMAAFNRFPVSLPLPREQQRIADFLSAIDTKIDLISQEISHAKAFKKGLLQQMFV